MPFYFWSFKADIKIIYPKRTYAMETLYGVDLITRAHSLS